jgi:hypothetical protein
MSRYEFRGRGPHVAIVVGWDTPLRTFFAQVWDERDEDGDEPLLWAGCRSGEVRTVEHLERLLSPYATIPPDVRELLTRQSNQPTK